MSNVSFVFDEDTIDIIAECEECGWYGELEMWVEPDRYTAECPCGDDIVILREY